ncbi:hypothetical protein ESA_02177 [Cronobacter sakazakii ATCC BAA-894]|uniref:Uncharacterized protein n=1 Tax=Cronobacter sakazakii (strain ATCC BAA-894) TaxID=290339 RepID=A7MNT2_CROS8|nr:hypothetical protein ESA_02177 [Cronobacter sakazakii ATCC BAA-894]
MLWQNIVVVPAISPKIVKKHQKQVKKADSRAAGILKMTRNARLKQAKKAARTATAVVVNNLTC